MTLPSMLRVPESARLKLALLLSPFALFFLVVGTIGGVDYLYQRHYRVPGGALLVGIVAAVYLTSSALVYLAGWHRFRSHVVVQCTAGLITFLVFALSAVVFVMIVGVH